MTEVPLDLEPAQSRLRGTRTQLIRPKRPAHGERTVEPQDRVKRSGEQSGPDVGTSRANEIVDDNAAAGKAIEDAECRNDLLVREVVKEERAGHVVEGPVLETWVLDIGTDQAEPVER